MKSRIKLFETDPIPSISYSRNAIVDGTPVALLRQVVGSQIVVFFDD